MAILKVGKKVYMDTATEEELIHAIIRTPFSKKLVSSKKDFKAWQVILSAAWRDECGFYSPKYDRILIAEDVEKSYLM